MAQLRFIARVFLAAMVTAFAMTALDATNVDRTVSVAATATTSFPPSGTAGTIDTLFGNDLGDGGAASNATLHGPNAVATDSAGNLFVLDWVSCRVRKISSGIITTIAGSGVCGFGGDGGLATSAKLYHPRGVAVDNAGNVYIADTGNCRVRKTDATTGIIRTIVGSGPALKTNCAYSGDNVAATIARLEPHGVALGDTGDLYITDSHDCRVRRLSAGVITTVAGTGTCGFSGDGGPATGAMLDYPEAVTVDPSGAVLIADTNNCVVRAVSGGTITTVAGNRACGYGGDNGPATSATLNYPASVAADEGGIYIADRANCRVRAIAGGVISTFAGVGLPGPFPSYPGCGFGGDGGPATSAELGFATGVAVAPDGTVYIADESNCRVRSVALNTITTAVGDGTCGYLAVAVDTDGTRLFFSRDGRCEVHEMDLTSGSVAKIAGTGTCGYSGDGGPASAASLDRPTGLAVDNTGDLFISDMMNCRVRQVHAGVIQTVAGNGTCGYSGDGLAAANAMLNYPADVALDSFGNLFISDRANCRVREVSAGVITTVAGTGTGSWPGGCGFAGDGGPATSAKLYLPSGVAVDGSGDVFVADSSTCVVRRISSGTISTIAGTPGTCYLNAGQLYTPEGLAADSSGHLFIANATACNVEEVNGPTMQPVAGGYSAIKCRFTGDGGAATNAGLQPEDVAVDSAGNLYILDAGNDRVRIVYGIMSAPDGDADGVPDVIDNCPLLWNISQDDTDSDGAGDRCDIDDDNDGLPDAVETNTGIFVDGNDTGTDPSNPDSDRGWPSFPEVLGDGCSDAKELLLVPPSNPMSPWDFYSVPVPALFAAPSPLTTFRDAIVSAGDAQAVFGYFKKAAKDGSAEYEQDLNANGIKDGVEYDRSVVVGSPGASGPPNGIVSASDAQLAFAQFKHNYKC